MKTIEQMVAETRKRELSFRINSHAEINYAMSRSDLVYFAALVAEQCAARCDGLAANRPMTGDGRLIAEACVSVIRAEFPKP